MKHLYYFENTNKNTTEHCRDSIVMVRRDGGNEKWKISFKGSLDLSWCEALLVPYLTLLKVIYSFALALMGILGLLYVLSTSF